MKRSRCVLDRILLTNDDGIDAPGLAILEAVAAELAHEVWVVAPEHDQSGEIGRASCRERVCLYV